MTKLVSTSIRGGCFAVVRGEAPAILGTSHGLSGICDILGDQRGKKKHFFFLLCVSRKLLNVSPMPLGYVVSLESRELLLRMMAEYPPLTSIGILLLFLGGGGPVCLALVTNERENHAK